MATPIDLGSTNNTLTLDDADYDVTGTNGANTLTLGNGTNTVTLGDGNNTLTFANGSNQIVLGVGNNTVTTGSGRDTITATDGNNTITVGDGDDTVTLGNGSDSVTSGNGNSTIIVGNGVNNTISVGTGSNAIFLGTGTGGVLNTQSGNNTLSIAAGSLAGDSILGNLSGTGVEPNTLVLTTAGIADATKVSGFGVYNLASGGTTTLALTDTNFSRVPGASIKVVEVSGGSTINASTVAAPNSVSVYLGSGANVATGGAGADFFYGSDGDQSIVNGGAGYDTMIFSKPLSDYDVTRVNGVITVVGNGENDTLTSIENIVFNGNLTAVLTSDTGFSNTDGFTSNDAVMGTAEAGTIVAISEGNVLLGTTTADANGNWAYAPQGLADGSHTVTVSETNVAGTTSSASVNLTLETGPPVLTAGLASDTGASPTDNITSNPALSGTAEAGSLVTISDGGALSVTATADANGFWTYTPAGLVDGAQTFTASYMDAAGNPNSANIAFTLDTAAPVVTAGLSNDTGASRTDGITADGTLAGNAEAGSTVTILNGAAVLGTTMAATDGSWSYTPTGLADGPYTLTASETDIAGNTGTASVGLTLESTTPGLTFALQDDTGTSATDRITNNPGLSGTAQAGSVVTITDGGALSVTATADANGVWTYTPAGLVDGPQTFTASYTDAAGNPNSANIAFTLDTAAPVVTAGLSNDTGASGTDGITADGTLTGTAEVGSTVTILNGTTVLGTTSVAADGSWNYTPTGLTDGAYTLTASDTDIAGNTGTTSVGLTLDTTAPALTLVLQNDTGTSATDGITNDLAIIGTADGPGTIVVSLNGQVVANYPSPGGQQTYTPASLADGVYHVVVTDTDSAGNVSTAFLDGTVDTTAPVVTAALANDSGAPGNNGVTNNDSLAGTAEAGSTVTILNGTTILGTTTVGTDGGWSLTPIGLANGDYSLTASQTDIAGNTGTATVGFTLDTAVPTVTAKLANDTGASAHDGITSDATLVGTAAAGTTVTIAEGNAVLGVATADSAGSWGFAPSTLAIGNHTLTVSQTDIAGNTGTAIVGVTLTATAPYVTAGLVQDTGASATDGVTSVDSLVGNAEPGGTVTILNGDTVLGTTTAAVDGSWTYTPTGLADGNYSLSASQTDGAGNTASAPINFTLDTAAPVLGVTLANDTSGSQNITRDPALVATTNDPGTITVSIGGQVLETYATTGGAQTITPQGLADGTYQIGVTETDTAGNTGTASLNFTVDTTAPVVTAGLANDTGSSAADGVTNTAALTGKADSDGIVTVLNGTTILGTTVAGSDGTWNFTPTGLPDGTVTLTASQTDAAGNTGSSTVDVTLLTAIPVVTATLVGHDGSVSSNDVTLAGTAQGSSQVTIGNGSTAIGTTIADANGNWNYTTDSLADGNYNLTASQADVAGNTGTATVSLALDHIYTANVNNIDNASNVFIILDKPGRTANIDLTNNTQPVTVFGGGANMNLTAGNALVVMNGPGQTNATSIHSLGNDFLWGGQSTIDMDGVSGNRMVLSGTGPTSGTLNLNTAGPAFNLIDVWGTTGTTETINNLGTSATQIFGGRSDIDFTGGNSLIIVNQADQTGNLTVQSSGGNTVWTGSSSVTFNEGTSGDDTVVLSGSGTTVVHGTVAPSTGTTTIAEYKGTGQFEYDGGTKAASISIGEEHATVFGGTGNQTINLNGGGSLVVADADTVSGLQTIVVAPGSSGSLEFWGGYGTNDTAITLGAGSAFIQAGGGNDTLTGGSGNFSLDLAASVNTLVNIDGSKSGAVNIMGYTGSNATLNVTNVDSQAVVGGSLVMHLHDGSSVTFQSYVPDANQASVAKIG